MVGQTVDGKAGIAMSVMPNGTCRASMMVTQAFDDSATARTALTMLW